MIHTVEVKPMNSRLYGGLGTAAQGRAPGLRRVLSHLKIHTVYIFYHYQLDIYLPQERHDFDLFLLVQVAESQQICLPR